MKSASFSKDFDVLVGCVQRSGLQSSSDHGWSPRSEYRTVFVAIDFIDKVFTDSSGAATTLQHWHSATAALNNNGKLGMVSTQLPKALAGGRPYQGSVRAAPQFPCDVLPDTRILAIESEPQLHSQPSNASDGKVSTQEETSAKDVLAPWSHMRQSCSKVV